jgi:plasmid stabilization system protein ParE
MNYSIQWSPTATNEFADLLSYLDNNYGTEIALSFLERTEKIVRNLEQFPLLHPLSDKFPGIRKAVINKQSSLLYRVKNNIVHIMHIWDNRQGYI